MALAYPSADGLTEYEELLVHIARVLTSRNAVRAPIDKQDYSQELRLLVELFNRYVRSTHREDSMQSDFKASVDARDKYERLVFKAFDVIATNEEAKIEQSALDFKDHQFDGVQNSGERQSLILDLFQVSVNRILEARELRQECFYDRSLRLYLSLFDLFQIQGPGDFCHGTGLSSNRAGAIFSKFESLDLIEWRGETSCYSWTELADETVIYGIERKQVDSLLRKRIGKDKNCLTSNGEPRVLFFNSEAEYIEVLGMIMRFKPEGFHFDALCQDKQWHEEPTSEFLNVNEDVTKNRKAVIRRIFMLGSIQTLNESSNHARALHEVRLGDSPTAFLNETDHKTKMGFGLFRDGSFVIHWGIGKTCSGAYVQSNPNVEKLLSDIWDRAYDHSRTYSEEVASEFRKKLDIGASDLIPRLG